MTPEEASARAALLLIARLVQRHELTPQEASVAVEQARRKETGPHTHLVTLEAMQVLRAATAPIRATLEALRPIAEAAAAMAELARALAPVAQQTTAARRDLPAWTTPHWPPPRRR
ncbi:hypothetical protein [Streptomyces sp. NBC_01744]|uniref:hypothetical protein n=1 Tax=Streptomyces sp. NBC_01744 TaxID=2975927 RepID=UPI003D9A4A82|nr:hypothetical protein OIE70_36340 [Streptomyces sp. NBC_01744]